MTFSAQRLLPFYAASNAAAVARAGVFHQVMIMNVVTRTTKKWSEAASR